MKILVFSDIHGSSYYLNKVLEIEKEYDYIVILGDILYHGPRNAIPKGYNPKEVIEILNNRKNKIIAIRGNCDSEVDQMVLNFPMLSDYSTLLYENIRIFLTHGHKFDKEYIVNILNDGDVVLSGHTHLIQQESYKNILFLNPGSISIPKGEESNSYAIVENSIFLIKNLSGTIIKSIDIKQRKMGGV